MYKQQTSDLLTPRSCLFRSLILRLTRVPASMCSGVLVQPFCDAIKSLSLEHTLNILT